MVIDNQHWKPTHIFPEHYRISDSGELYSIRADRILRFSVDPDGYRYYVLCVAGERHTVRAHRLVALAFIPNPDEKPAIDHINGIKTDNRADNLRWCSNKENSHNPVTYTKLKKSAIARLPKMYEKSRERNFGRKAVAVCKNGKLIRVFGTQRLASEYTGASEGHISSCLSGNRKSSKGYTFKRIDDKLCVECQ